MAACRLNDTEDSPMDVSEETLKNDQPNSVEETRNGDTKFKQSFSLHNLSAQDLPNTTDAGEITDNVESMEITEHIEEVPAEAHSTSSATLPDQPVESSAGSVRRSDRRKGRTSYSMPKVGENISWRR